MKTFRTLFHALKFFLRIEEPGTQLTLGEIALIKKYAQDKPRCVEIGVYEGATTAVIAKSMERSGILFAIDPFFKGKLSICWGKIIAKTHLKRAGVYQKVKLIEKLSYKATSDIGGDIDFCFIDGDHRLQAFRRDWNDWSRKIKKDGYIALHDIAFTPLESPVPLQNSFLTGFTSEIQQRNPDAVRFLQDIPEFGSAEFGSAFELVEHVDSLAIFKRK